MAMDLSWSTTTSRKTSLLEDEREPHFLMMDSDVTQHSMDSLDGFNSEVELFKLERSRTMPVSALYAAIDAEEELNKRLSNGRSLSMGSLGSLWDQDYKQRATEYNKELPQEKEATTDEDEDDSPRNHVFRLHSPIPEEQCSSDESITYVFMNPSTPPSSTPTNPSAIKRRDSDTSAKRKPAQSHITPPSRPISQQPRTLSMDSIDVEQYMNFINRPGSAKYCVETPHTTLERKLKRENSGIRIESTDQEYSGAEQTPYYVDGLTTDPETGPEHSPRLWSFLKKRPQVDSGSDYEGNNLPNKQSICRPTSTSGRRQSAKVRRKVSRTRVVETQTDEEITGVSSTPSSPGYTRKTFDRATNNSNDNYQLMRSLTSGGPFAEAGHQLAKGQLEPTVHLLTEVVSLMKIMMTNMQQPNQQKPHHCCHKCQCTESTIKEIPAIKKTPSRKPSALNLSAFSDTTSSDTERSPSRHETLFKQGFLIEQFRQSRQDRIATCKSTSDIASCASDIEPDSLRLSGASTPTDEFKTLPIIQKTIQQTTKSEETAKLDHADSGISDRWESQASSSGSSSLSRRNRSRVSSESTSAGPSSLSSTDTADSSSGGQPVLTQWAQLSENPVRTSTPVHMTSWAAAPLRDNHCTNTINGLMNASTETTVSYKTTKSHFSRNDSIDDEVELPTSRKLITRPSKLEMKKERERREQEQRSEKKSPLDELKKKWLTPCDSLFPGDEIMFPSTQTKLQCSPDVTH